VEHRSRLRTCVALQVHVESLQGEALDYSLLAGKWRLIYTTATDVLPILEAEFRFGLGPFSGFGLPRPLRVGNIYQRFTSPEQGVVENIINFETPLLDSIVFTVGARWARAARTAPQNGSQLCPALWPPTPPSSPARHHLTRELLLPCSRFQIRRA
jgi:hypothetical protein